MREVARVHRAALPHTLNSRLGETWLTWLYWVVGWIGTVETVKKGEKVIGAMACIGQLIVTLVVQPEWQRRGVGRELLSKLKGKSYVYTEQCSVGFYEKMGFTKWGQLGGIIVLCKK